MKYFEKNAFKYNKPGHIKKFVLMPEEQIFNAVLRQKGVKKLLGAVKYMTKDIPGGFHTVTKELKKRIKGKFKGDDPANLIFSGTMKSGKIKINPTNFGEERTIGGTVFKTPKGTSIGINKDIWSDLSKSERRKFLAHEAFHANVPVLGKSEILAHAYGGLKSKKGKISYKSAINEIKHLKKSRPERLYLELGGIGAATATTAAVVHTAKKKLEK
jgi:hypothetical protein